MRLQWEDDPYNNNPNTAYLHVDVRLPRVSDATFSRPFGWREDEASLSPGDKLLITTLVAIPRDSIRGPAVKIYRC